MQELEWHQELSLPVGPKLTEGVLHISLCDASGAAVALGERSLATVLSEDVDRAELQLQDMGGHAAGSVDLVRCCSLCPHAYSRAFARLASLLMHCRSLTIVHGRGMGTISAAT